MRKKAALSPRKQPLQQRGQQTYRSIVAATARVLERKGYEALTTNHVAKVAGVGIASVYEYFPGKHALVAAVVSETVADILDEIGQSLEHALRKTGRDAITLWIGTMFEAIEKRRRLVAVLVQEVPFFWQVPAVQDARAVLVQLSRRGRPLRRGAPSPHLEAMTHLMPIMVANAVIDSVVRPPAELSAAELRAALVDAVHILLLSPS